MARADNVAFGLVHHFGKFSSERDASDWIADHPWLAERPTFPEPRQFDIEVKVSSATNIGPSAPYFELDRQPRLIFEAQWLPAMVAYDEAGGLFID